jgi:HEAT repeat protein
MATLDQLIAVRSQLADDIKTYCEGLVRKLDRTPWHRDGQNLRASAVAVHMRVLKQSTRPDPRERERRDEPEHERERAASRDYTDPELARLYEEAAREERQEEAPWEQERPQVRRAVVKGGPGGGKSFLTQTTGIALAQAALDTLDKREQPLDKLVLPVHLTLSAFADPTLPPDPALAVLELLRREYQPPERFLGWLAPRLATASIWLLLDALDEVPEEHWGTLAGRLRALDGHRWQTRVLLTCRPANWDRARIPWPELTEYELAPLNEGEIRQFIRRWHTAEPGRGNALLQALERNYPLAHAARSPLIATFLCLAHAEAPVTTATRRTALYAQMVRGLARRAWKAQPLAKTEPHVDDLVAFLIALARPLFERHPAGNLFTHGDLMAGLKAAPDRPRAWLDGQKAGRGADDLRDELLETGILVGAGLRDGEEGQYSFAHRSLLEYLVARNLNAEIEAGGWQRVAGFVDRKCWHPAWQESVTLLAGMMKDPAPLLRLLADSTKDDALRHRLCLAGRCLPELSDAGKAACREARPPLPDIAREVLELWWRNEEQSTRFSHVENIMPVIGAASAAELIPELLKRAENPEHRARAIEALGAMGSVAATPEVLQRLMDCLQDPNSYAGSRAEMALGEMGSAAATPEVFHRLIAWLQDQNWLVYSVAQRALNRMGSAAATPEVLHWLTALLQDRNVNLISRATKVLGGLGSAAATPEVLQRLADLLQDADGGLRCGAAEALGQMGSTAATLEVLRRLTDLLQSTERHVRSRAAEALGRMASAAATPEVLQRLADLLQDTDGGLRSDAAEALGRMASATATAEDISWLMALLQDTEWRVKNYAAVTLGRMGSAAAKAEVLQQLTDMLQSTDVSVHFGAAMALGEMGSAVATTEVLSWLMSLLQDTERDLRINAAEVLGRMGLAAATPKVLQHLMAALLDRDVGVRSRVAWALGEMGAAATTAEVLMRLTDCLQDPAWDVRINAAEALGRMGLAAATPEVLQHLVEWLRVTKMLRCSDAAKVINEFLQDGVRWFPQPDGKLVVRTVAQLSGEPEAHGVEAGALRST